jgi:hypothetical protein
LLQPGVGSLRSEADVKDLETMLRAIRIGLFIGVVIGMSL